MVNPRERIATYLSQGLVVDRGFWRSGDGHGQHSHSRTILATHSGSLALTLHDQTPPRKVELLPGSEFIIESGVEHSAVAGDKGWGYVVGREATKHVVAQVH